MVEVMSAHDYIALKVSSARHLERHELTFQQWLVLANLTGCLTPNKCNLCMKLQYQATMAILWAAPEFRLRLAG